MPFLEVILPVPVGQKFTYSVAEDEACHVVVGSRVVVPFGKSKLYTGIVVAIHNEAPQQNFEIKEITELLDDKPIVGPTELRLWQWIADYYMCLPGDVMKAALPSGLKITSETAISIVEDFSNWDLLTKTELQLIETIQAGKHKSIATLQKQAAQSSIMHHVRSLINKGALCVSENLVRSFKPKRESHVRLAKQYLNEQTLNQLFESLQHTPRRYNLLINLVELANIHTAIKLRNPQLIEEVSRAQLLKHSGASAAVLMGLKAKGIVEIYDYEVGRLHTHAGSVVEQLPLSQAQQEAYDAIHREFAHHNVCLLHGVTSSGKTEIYIRLIKHAIAQGKQVLYLLPEIALTTQITKRLQRIFGNEMGVYHSKFPDAERVEIWQKQLSKEPYKLILGVRSSLFLPQQNLGLIIVDEEHETSYKQQDPAPRYGARDTAIMLATMHKAKVLLGTATPSIETYHNCLSKKFGYVRIDKRFGDVQMPEIEVIDVQDLTRRKMMKPPFSPRLEEEIQQALDNKEQVILFQNRRGYAPIVECTTCGWVPRCQFCDVSLTYHQNDNKLHCHYCGNSFAVPHKCPNCEGQNLKSLGYGTQKIEEEVKLRFPQARTARLDLDTTRSRLASENIISDFANGKTDILIGTQMVTKGLDFDRVRVVGILDADTLINRPDFRSHERAYQMLSQVAGRAGRRGRQGRVILQTRRAQYPLIQQVVDNDYASLYHEQIDERKLFYYPPFYRLIYIWFKHRNEAVVAEAANIAAQKMKEAFGGGILGPDKPTVSRVQMLNIRKVALKVSPSMPIASVRQQLHNIMGQICSIPHLRSTIIYFDVDPI